MLVRRERTEDDMTAITRWRAAGATPKHIHRSLPEPPRTHRVSKVAREPKDRLARVLEDWLSDLAVATTFDGD
jgi:hypothetical protein